MDEINKVDEINDVNKVDEVSEIDEVEKDKNILDVRDYMSLDLYQHSNLQ